MTNSTNLSNDDLKEILFSYLIGNISLMELKSLLDGFITIDFENAPERREIRDIQLNENIKIIVNNSHLLRMFEKYLSGQITLLDLSNWAAFIYFMINFIPEGDSEDERWKSGEGPFWDILQKLSTVDFVKGDSTQKIRIYIKQLKGL